MADYTLSSGNVFQDLGLPSPDERLAKAKLAYKINHLIANQRMTQKAAADCLGISRSKMTALRNGRLKNFTIDYLASLLGKLDPHIELASQGYLRQGIEAYHKGEYDCAIENFTKAIVLKPNDANVYNHRGVVYYYKGDYDHAIEDFTKTIELNPNNVETYLHRGLAYQSKGDYDRAIKDYTKAIELNPNYAQAYYNRGIAYGVKGDYDRAIEDYTKAMALKSN